MEFIYIRPWRKKENEKEKSQKEGGPEMQKTLQIIKEFIILSLLTFGLAGFFWFICEIAIKR